MALGLRENAELLAGLRERLRTTLSRYVPEGSTVALLDFPNHSNVGDCAIWLGEVAFLTEMGCRIVYKCDIHSYNPGHLRRNLGDHGIVLLHGGGNFGDVWPLHQHFRERVLGDLVDHRVVILPQTIHFRDGRALDSARMAVDRHPSLTILTRDEGSSRFARQHFNATIDLAPDMAIWLRSSGRPHSPLVDVLWLARTDPEAVAFSEVPEAMKLHKVDWLDVDRSDMSTSQWLKYRTMKRLTGLAKRTGGRSPGISNLQRSMFGPVASSHYARGRQLLSLGRVVIADRLHAHLLCLLMGIPHVLLDNNYGKLLSFWRTWSRESTLTHWASNPSDAWDTACSLAQS